MQELESKIADEGSNFEMQAFHTPSALLEAHELQISGLHEHAGTIVKASQS